MSLLKLFKDTLGVEPAETQELLGMVAIPWSFKIFYGFSSDNIKLFGSKRKGHLLICSGCCILSMAAIIIFGTHFGKYFVAGCVFVS